MRSAAHLLVILLLPPTVLLDQFDNLPKESDDGQGNEKVNCVKDIGVAPLESLRYVQPHYQLFVFDLSGSQETFNNVRRLFIQAACLYSAASNHIRIGYIALVGNNKVNSEPNIPDIRDFIGRWTEFDDKMLGGLAQQREAGEPPLNNCQKSDLLGQIVTRFKPFSSKPFRMLSIDDQRTKKGNSSNVTCDQPFEFGKALWRRNISLDDFILDEVAVREEGHSNIKSVVQDPVFEMSSLEDTSAFLNGMRAYIDRLQDPETWTNQRVKTAISEAEAALLLEDYDQPTMDDIEIIDFNEDKVQSEGNVTNPDDVDVLSSTMDYADDDADDHDIGIRKAAVVPEEREERPPQPQPQPPFVLPQVAAVAAPAAGNTTTTVAPTTTSTANATTAAAAIVAAAGSSLDWWIILLIVLAALIIAFVIFLIFCCWYDKRKLNKKIMSVSTARLATARSQKTPLVGVSTKKSDSSGSSSKRPLKLTNNNINDQSSPEAPLLEKNLPDPYSPVKYINTPVPIASDIEMTHTEHVVPPTMDEALNKHVATPMDKVPELHLDDYHI